MKNASLSEDVRSANLAAARELATELGPDWEAYSHNLGTAYVSQHRQTGLTIYLPSVDAEDRRFKAAGHWTSAKGDSPTDAIEALREWCEERLKELAPDEEHLRSGLEGEVELAMAARS